ncbi:hypothetical protein [Cohnella herbarum]|uniref:Lipoprotein n=1 Tax=Cohnella herbarum TaxID=2728023 RepID=A0A7Z2ZMJ3_9BACL|nr:hypothetical protein [Cohnella herbarum]QJD85133.1 hypothetical protein HH215_19460 [Cohnella herbarum]
MARIRSLLLISLIAMYLTGCTESISSPIPTVQTKVEKDLILELMRHNEKDVAYRTYKVIKDAMVATEIKYILKQSEESNSLVSMTRPPDRKIALVDTNPTASSEPQIYGIWFSPKSDLVEVVSESTRGGGYIQLNEDYSGAILQLFN